MMSMTNEEISVAKILIVDDYLSNVMLLRRMLNNAGYQNVLGIIDSREAIESCRQFQPDIVLLDLLMPLKDGFEVMKQLNQETKLQSNPFVLVITSDDDHKSRCQALLLGASEVIRKPINLTELLLQVRNAVQKHHRNQIIHQRVQTLKENLQILPSGEMFSEVIPLFTAMDEDHYIREQHTTQFSLYTARLAEAAALDSGECELISHACILHDIGKFMLPKTILTKPHKLSMEEFAVIKTHTWIGAKLLSGNHSSLMQMAETIALTHHEKWDGSGYPNSLCGEDIPLVGRICAITDVFDALTTKRPYRPAWSNSDALNYIESESGNHFDSRLTRLFLKIQPLIST